MKIFREKITIKAKKTVSDSQVHINYKQSGKPRKSRFSSTSILKCRLSKSIKGSIGHLVWGKIAPACAYCSPLFATLIRSNDIICSCQEDVSLAIGCCGQSHNHPLTLDMGTTIALHYGFCPLVKLTFKDLAKLTAFAAIFKTKSYFR